MNTNLLGRTIKAQFAGGGSAGTIVALYIDRGVMFLGIENPEGGLYSMSFDNARLVPVSDLHPSKKEESS